MVDFIAVSPVRVRSATVDSYSLYVYGLKDVEEPPLYVSIACQETDGDTFRLLIHQPGESTVLLTEVTAPRTV